MLRDRHYRHGGGDTLVTGTKVRHRDDGGSAHSRVGCGDGIDDDFTQQIVAEQAIFYRIREGAVDVQAVFFAFTFLRQRRIEPGGFENKCDVGEFDLANKIKGFRKREGS